MEKQVIIFRTQIIRTTDALASPACLGRRNIMCDEKISDGVGGDEPHRWSGRLYAGKNKIPHFHQRRGPGLAHRVRRRPKNPPSVRLAQFDCVASASRALISVSFFAPFCSFGSGIPTKVMSPFFEHRAPVQRSEVARAVHAQQSKPAFAILGDPVGIAQTGGDNHLTSACELRSVTMWPRLLTTSPFPYSTGFAIAANGMLRSGNGENALTIAGDRRARWFPSSDRKAE